MPDNVYIDPDLLRQLAEKHDGIADDTRKWAQPPSDWLNAFPKTYGKIAHPVHQALLRYYTARERAGNALAKEHEATANSLRE
uniref:type VII secretion target n=1 Tax=Nocardia wallacei TaxID=480035 RepID=UPI002453B733